MAVARLGSASTANSTNALAHTIAAGNNRCLMVCVTQEVSSPTQLAVGYGGQSMTAVVGINVGDATDGRIDIYYLNDAGIAAAGDNQIDVTGPPATYTIMAQSYENAMQTTPTVVDSEAVTGDSDPLTNIQISAVADEAVFGGGGTGNTTTGLTWAGTNPLTALADTDANATAHGAIADRLVTGTETVNHNLTWTTAPNRVFGAACLIEHDPGVTREQEGFQWREDDGSESAASDIGAQDANLSAPALENKRLRVLLDYGGDPATETRTLEYRLVGDGAAEWRPVPL